MFTGLVEALGEVETLAREGAGRRVAVRVPPGWTGDVGAGDSVAVNGVCLTAVTVDPGRLAFDLAEETLRVTTLGELAPGDRVNLERPLRLGGRVGGHLVLGHVDGVGRVVTIRPEGGGRRLGVAVPPAVRPLLIPKGSVAVDGVSLTVAGLDDAGFTAALIPHTLTATTLGVREVGARVNLEMDVIGKYVQALVGTGDHARDLLERHGLLAPEPRG
jgi:riboflavin synthase